MMNRVDRSIFSGLVVFWASVSGIAFAASEDEGPVFQYPYDFGLDVSFTEFDDDQVTMLTAQWNKRYLNATWVGLGLAATATTVSRREDGIKSESSGYYGGLNIEQTLYESYQIRVQTGVLLAVGSIYKRFEPEDVTIEPVVETGEARVAVPSLNTTFYRRWGLKFGLHLAMRIISMSHDELDAGDFAGVAYGLTFRSET